MRVSLTYRRQSVSLSDNKKKENKNGGREYKEKRKKEREEKKTPCYVEIKIRKKWTTKRAATRRHCWNGWTPRGANVTRVNVPLITLINKALCLAARPRWRQMETRARFPLRARALASLLSNSQEFHHFFAILIRSSIEGRSWKEQKEKEENSKCEKFFVSKRIEKGRENSNIL